MRRSLVVVLGILAHMALPGRASATTVLALTVEEMAAGSDRVVRARVVSQSIEVDESESWIYRLTTLEVLEDISGEGPSRVVVRQLGGADEWGGMFVEGDAVFEPGEEVVVFLRANGGREPVVHLEGFGLGKFSVERLNRGPVMLRRSLEGMTFVRPDGLEVRLEARLELEALRERVRRGVSTTNPETNE